jgi:hypothetical protein
VDKTFEIELTLTFQKKDREFHAQIGDYQPINLQSNLLISKQTHLHEEWRLLGCVGM